MRSSSNGNTESTGQDDSTYENSTGAPWKCLFAFTSKKHAPFLIGAFVTSICTGCIVPTEAFLYGKLFSYFASFAAGNITKNEFMHSVNKYSVYLVLLGSAVWFSQTAFFFLWTSFGSIQVGVARDRLFNGMLKREIAWYDMRKHGVGSLLTRLNMFVYICSSDFN